MGDQDSGNPQLFLDPAYLGPKFYPNLGIQGRQGLIQKEKGRFQRDGSGQGDPLLLSSGKLRGIFFPMVIKIHHFQYLPGPFFPLLF